MRALTAGSRGRAKRGTRASVRALALGLLALAALAAGCRSEAPRRAHTLARAGRLDERIAADSVVWALRTPTDTGRIIYDPPTDLALPESASTTPGGANARAVGATASAPAAGGGSADSARKPGSASASRDSTAMPAPGSAGRARPRGARADSQSGTRQRTRR